MPKQISWEKIPEQVQKLSKLWFRYDQKSSLEFANQIMQAVKVEQEKAYMDGYDTASSYETVSPADFKTWYAKTYLK